MGYLSPMRGLSGCLCLAASIGWLSACGASGSDCDRVAAHAARLVDNPQAGKDKIAAACRAGKWTAEVRSCVVAATNAGALETCMRQVPAFVTYETRSKTSEARELLHRLYNGALSYYLTEAYSKETMAVLPAQFPDRSTKPTPPVGSCCRQGGKCAPDASLWRGPTWAALGFSVEAPHYYSYQYEVVNPGASFVVRAFGNLDCDGDYSTFAQTGVMTADGPAEDSGELVRDRELE